MSNPDRGRRPHWLETARVEHAGNERGDHTHDWEFGPPDLSVDPPQYPKICAECGRLEVQQHPEREPRSYEELYEQFHGEE